MKQPSYHDRLTIFILITFVVSSARWAQAQEAEVVTTLAREIVEGLGRDAAVFGGEEAARQTATRLMAEAAEASGDAGRRVAQAQVERLIAQHDPAIVMYLKTISFRELTLLEVIPDKALGSALGTLARPGVAEGVLSLGSTASREAALSGEVRLPGAGLKLVERYGEDGIKLTTELNEDQANSVIAAVRLDRANALPKADRADLLNTLASRPDARVFNYGALNGPLVVVARGLVIWHGLDLMLSPDERVTERPDGTVIREKTSVSSRFVQSLPMAARELSNPIKWTGVTLAAGISLMAAIYLSRRRKQVDVQIAKTRVGHLTDRRC